MDNRGLADPAPLLLVLVAFSYGIFLSAAPDGLPVADFTCLTIFSCFCLLLFFMPLAGHGHTAGEKGWPLTAKHALCLAASLLIVFAAGILHQQIATGNLDTSQEILSMLAETGKEQIFSGVVIKAATPVKNGCRSIIYVNSLEEPGGRKPVHERLAVTFKGLSWNDLEPGQAIRFQAGLRKVRNFRTPGTFDYENWWALRGIRIRAWCSSNLKVVDIPARAVRIPWHMVPGIKMERVRFNITRQLCSFFHDNDRQAVAIALLIGSRQWFSERFRQEFSASGLGHLLAVSGLHMAMIAAFAAVLARFLLGCNEWILLNMNVRAISCLSAAMACFIYAAVAGFSPSSTRAFIMILALSLAFVMRRPGTALNSLALAALALLVLNPFYLSDISFQLSFYVVFFLIHWSSMIRLQGSNIRSRVTQFLFLTIAAFCAAAPMVAFYFQRFTPMGTAMNLAAIPLTEFLLLPLLFMGLILSLLLPFAPNIFWHMASYSLSMLSGIVHLAARIQGIYSYVPPPSIGQLCLITALFLLVPYAWKQARFRRPAALIAVLLAIVTGWQHYQRTHRNNLLLHVPDVGQGLCQVVEFPRGKTMVFDAGGMRSESFDIGKSVVARYLRRIGINRIDVLAVSHPDMDHIGGIPALLREFPVGRIWMNQDANPGLPAYRETIRLAREKRIPVTRLEKIAHVAAGLDPGTSVTILPCQECPPGSRRNSRCLVFRLNHGNAHALLPGDIERQREKQIISRADVSAKLLIIPHHGSRTSSSPGFLRAVSPAAAVCPVGYGNRFHLPSRQVISRYRELGIPVFRTDMDGTVDVRLNASGRLEIHTYMGGKASF